jgi:ribosome-associated protein
MPVRRSVDVLIREEPVRLGQFLKLAGLAEVGSGARELVAAGAVLVNGEPGPGAGGSCGLAAQRGSAAIRPALTGGQGRLPP